MICVVNVVLDRPRNLVVSEGALTRMKTACGVDLARGDKMRTHHDRCCFVWSMIHDEALRPEDLAPYLTLTKFTEIAEAIERTRRKVRQANTSFTTTPHPRSQHMWS